MTRIRFVRLGIVGILVVGVLLALITAFFWLHTHQFVVSAKNASGTVVDLPVRHDKDRDVYYAVFQFTDDKGAKHKAESLLSSSNRRYAICDTVPVLYDPSKPANAELNELWSIWLVPVYLGILAGLILLNGVGLWALFRFQFARSRRRGRGNPTAAPREGVLSDAPPCESCGREEFIHAHRGKSW
jgi:hypothetical protein